MFPFRALVGLPRQPGELELRLARRACARVSHLPAADASPASLTSEMSWSASHLGMSVGVFEPQPASATAHQPGREERGAGSIGPRRL